MSNSPIEKFFSGNTSDEERKIILEWLKDGAAEKEVQKQIIEYFKSDNDKKIIWNNENSLQSLKGKLNLANHDTENSGTEGAGVNGAKASKDSQSRWSFQGMLVKTAAVFVILIASYLVFRQLDKNYFLSVPSITSDIERGTEKGQKLSIYLADGSKVILNSDSRITYPKEFETDSRRVILEGEAFFEISKNPQKPFIVQTGAFETVVLGTSFIVNADPDCDKISVALKSGEVLVRQKPEEKKDSPVFEKVRLIPGKMVTIDITSGTNDISGFDEISVFAWTNNILYFKEEKLKNVFRRLETWYNVKFVFNNNYENKKDIQYSGKFENESLENVLTGLSYINDFEFDIEGKIVEVNFR